MFQLQLYQVKIMQTVARAEDLSSGGRRGRKTTCLPTAEVLYKLQ